jgi:hypothetical protein
MSLERPSFRRDLQAVPMEADGERYVEVRDPRTGGTFVFYDFEYRVALAFDGLVLDKVVPWVKLSTGLELSVDQLQAFAERLAELGFLEGEGGSTAEGAAKAPMAAETPEVVEEVEAVVAAESLDEVEAVEVAEPPTPPEAGEVRPQPTAGDDDASTSMVGEPSAPPAVEIATTKVEDDAAAESGSSSSVAPDSTAFPVLPAPVPRVPVPEAAPPSVPPPWTTPRPLMTPVPVTFGPIVERPSTRRQLRRSLILFGSLGVLAAAAMLALVLPFLFSRPEPPRPRVRTLTAAPSTVLRYFDGAGVVESVPGLTLKFPAAGKVTRMAGVGSALASGDVAAAVAIAKPLQDQLARQRERLAYYQQMAEAMHQVGNSKEEEQQAAKAELRSATIAKTLRALADVAVVMSAPGLVDETFAREGDTVQAGSPALRLRSAGFRAAFELSRQQAAQARRLGFCQVESGGYVFDCSRIQDGGDATHLSVEIASLPHSLLGKAAHLARARFEGAYVLPLAAVVRTGSRDEVLLVSGRSRVEPRPVTIAERDATEAIVVQGLDAGDQVIVEAAPGLHAGAQVSQVPQVQIVP